RGEWGRGRARRQAARPGARPGTHGRGVAAAAGPSAGGRLLPPREPCYVRPRGPSAAELLARIPAVERLLPRVVALQCLQLCGRVLQILTHRLHGACHCGDGERDVVARGVGEGFANVAEALVEVVAELIERRLRLVDGLRGRFAQRVQVVAQLLVRVGDPV